MEIIFAKDPSYVPLATYSCGVKSIRTIDKSLIEPGNSELMTAESSSSDEPTPKRKKKSSKKNSADQLEKISSHMTEFNDIFKDLVKAENEKNALQKLLDK
ncbi:uncharacterized protein LOC111029731 [Myzus persicae]|uniref:uncharacterized protein LOC111029731 n=1 Tax=Myzus persicae TaxID=13164 RepID=UPI000B92F9D9|nr:uncharacterized protein LOC111029731 [Myzus persicae]